MASRIKVVKQRKLYVAKIIADGYIECSICKLPIIHPVSPSLGGVTVDHIIPISLGGDYKSTINMSPAHEKCNHFKSNSLDYHINSRHLSLMKKMMKQYKHMGLDFSANFNYNENIINGELA